VKEKPTLVVPIAILFAFLVLSFPTVVVAQANEENGVAPAEEVAAASSQADEEAEAPSEEEVIEIEVIGERPIEEPVPSLAPSPGELVSTVTSEEVQATGQTTVPDAIQFMPSVQMTRQGRRMEVFASIRGTQAPNVLMDGAAFNTITGGTAHAGFGDRFLYILPPSVVEGIEVIRSSSSLVYGPEALTGGVINIVTKSGEGPPKIEIGSSAGNYQTWRNSLSYSQGDSKGGVVLTLERESGDTNLVFNHRAMNYVFAKIHRSLSNGDLLKFTVVNDDGGRQLAMWSEAFMAANPSFKPTYWSIDPWRERVCSLTYSHALKTPDSGIDLILWNRDRYYSENFFAGPIAPTAGASVNLISDDNTWGSSLIYRVPVSKHHLLRLGPQWYNVDASETTLYLDPATNEVIVKPSTPTAPNPRDAGTKLWSYVAQDEWTAMPGLRCSFGARYQAPTDRKHALTYALGLERDLVGGAQAYAHFGTGVRYPTYAQLESNPNIKDQHSQNYDLGVSGSLGPNVVGRVGVFLASIKDSVVTYLTPGGDPAKPTDWVTTNTDHTTYGIEFEAQGRRQLVAKGEPAGSLAWFANFSLNNRKVERTVIGDQPVQVSIPPHSVINVGARWVPEDKRTQVSFTLRASDHYLATSGYLRGAWNVGAYKLGVLQVAHDIAPNLKLTGTINNLFNSSYETMPGFPEPRRNFKLGLSTTFGLAQ